MFIEILKYGFLAIFFATAVLGIISIPGWIKIPEWYRKRIFIALILEVIGVIIILFKQEIISPGSTGVPAIEIKDNNWIALDDSALIVKPEILIETKDTAITKQLGKQSLVQFKGLTGKIVKDGLSVRNVDSITLGYIAALDLEKSGLFNSFRTSKNEITSTENYAYIKWNKSLNGKWKIKGSFIGPFELEVDDYPGGTYYRIKNRKNEYIFDSRTSSKDLISRDNRIIHFFEYEHIYYLLRIAWADLDQDEKYVHVINVRMEPTFK